MQLKDVVLNVYETSKSEVSTMMTGNFTITETTRSGRTQVINDDTGKKYWVDSSTLVTEESAQEMTQEPVVSEEKETVMVDDQEPLTNEELPVKIVEPDKNLSEDNQLYVDKAKGRDIVTFVARRGDTMTTIAKLFNTTEAKLIALNGTESVVVGQTIYIQ